MLSGHGTRWMVLRWMAGGGRWTGHQQKTSRCLAGDGLRAGAHHHGAGLAHLPAPVPAPAPAPLTPLTSRTKSGTTPLRRSLSGRDQNLPPLSGMTSEATHEGSYSRSYRDD